MNCSEAPTLCCITWGYIYILVRDIHCFENWIPMTRRPWGYRSRTTRTLWSSTETWMFAQITLPNSNSKIFLSWLFWHLATLHPSLFQNLYFFYFIITFITLSTYTLTDPSCYLNWIIWTNFRIPLGRFPYKHAYTKGKILRLWTISVYCLKEFDNLSEPNNMYHALDKL